MNILMFVVCDSLISLSLFRSAILYHVTDLMSSFFEHSVDEVKDVVIKPLISVTFFLTLPWKHALYSSRKLFKYF
jgi:hypothetical protein